MQTEENEGVVRLIRTIDGLIRGDDLFICEGLQV